MMSMVRSAQAKHRRVVNETAPRRFWYQRVRQASSVDAGRLRLTVLMPAHNEEAQIREALDSLLGQTRRPDRIIVICDNCTDRTSEIAAAAPGVEVVPTVGNVHRKAGALNQVLETLLPAADEYDVVLVMDADSVLDEGFVAAGLARLATGGASAVGGTFEGKAGGGFVGMLQRNEYARYSRDVRRQRGRTLVLTGTATLFRADLLAEVVRARVEGRLPGAAQVYDTRVLTEDNELTLAILTLGHGIVAPAACTLRTEVMATWRDLFRQRLRWKRGALENLVHYGLTRVTVEYWARQVLSLMGLVVIGAYLGTLVVALLLDGTVQVYPLWLAVTVVFAVERGVSVRRRGPAMIALGAVLVVEMVFDVFLQLAQATAFTQAALGIERRW